MNMKTTVSANIRFQEIALSKRVTSSTHHGLLQTGANGCTPVDV